MDQGAGEAVWLNSGALAQFLPCPSISHSSIQRSAGSSNLSLCPTCITCSSLTCMISFCKPKLRWVFHVLFGAEEAKTNTCSSNTPVIQVYRVSAFSFFSMAYLKFII